MQVGDIDYVGIDNSQGSYASGCQIKSGWAAQSACADEQDFGVEEFALSAFSHFGDEEVTGVALYFGFVERAVAVNGETGILPRFDVALDIRDVGIAHVLKGLRGQCALALSAIDYDCAVAVVVHAFDAEFEEATRYVFCAGDISFDIIFALAHVYEQRAICMDFLLCAFWREPRGAGFCLCDERFISCTHDAPFGLVFGFEWLFWWGLM